MEAEWSPPVGKGARRGTDPSPRWAGPKDLPQGQGRGGGGRGREVALCPGLLVRKSAGCPPPGRVEITAPSGNPKGTQEGPIL